MNLTSFLLVLQLFVLISLSQCNLLVVFPRDETFKADFSIANFGFIPYGSYVIGNLVLPKEGENKACESMDKEYYRE